MIIHIVKQNDTLFSIAKNYGVTIQELIRDNQIITPNKLAIGQNIVINIDELNYTIKRGDSLYYLSKKYDVPIESILTNNPEITDVNNLQIGQIIKIPIDQKYGNIEVNGYAIANINNNILESTLPYLSYLSIFSYQAKDDGSLTNLFEEKLINSARERFVAPLMVVTNIGISGNFDSSLAHEILTNKTVQNKLINNILETLKTKNYYGCDIDFEYIYPKDKDNYTNFLKELNSELKKFNYYLSVAVAPKYRANQPGLLYEAHDYKEIGKIADRVIIMTYEWGYMFGPPMAVSPYQEMKKVLSYAVTEIDSKKILMGLPNYGYDWTLPYNPKNPAIVISNNKAISLAIEENAKINFDNISKTPYFNYYDDKKNKHVVWFDDATSIYKKLNLVNEFNLAGISIWTINRLFNQMLLVINGTFNTIKVIN